MLNKKRGQVWIETVLYTLVAISLIALVLAFVTPKINQERDKGIVEQSINSLNLFDQKMSEVLRAPGNVRIAEVNVGKGIFYIDAANTREMVGYNITSISSAYSEPGALIKIGKVEIKTGANSAYVTLEINYSSVDIQFDGKDVLRAFPSASIPYRLSIKNEGINPAGDKYIINITDISS